MIDRNGMTVVLSALIVGSALVATGALVARTLDRTNEKLDAVVLALENAPRAAAPAAAAPPRRGLDPAQHYTVNTKGSPARGPAKASLEIVEFSDFQCPFCARVSPTLERIEQEYPDQVRIVFKHYPLRIHPKAPQAHAAAEAAHRQGKFWEMHDLIFANQKEMSPEKYEEWAQELGLDVDKFRADIASSEVKARVSRDSADASKLGITGTPAFFINGRPLSGAQPYDAFKALIDEELKEG